MKQALILLLSIGVSACASISPIMSFEPSVDVPDIVEAMPDSFANEGSAVPSSYAPSKWWTEFDDPVLNELVSVAQAQNFDIREGAARLAQANALARLAASAQSPNVNVTLSSNFSDSPLAGTGFGSLGGGGSNRLQIESVSPSLGASYELDLFGRIINDTDAAKSDAVAAAFDVSALRQSAVNEVISTYIEIVDAQTQIDIQGAIADLIAERLTLSETRFARGLIESFEVYQLDQDLRTVRAGIPQQESAFEQLIIRLALILGEYSDFTKDRLDQALQPQLVSATISTPRPISLLDQRPDIQSAWYRSEAARRRVGARKAERYPSLSFTGSLGSQGADIAEAANIFDNWALSLAQSLTGIVFDGGRTNAAIATAEAVYTERLEIYAETVVRAHGEVEAALADLRLQEERYQLVFGQLEATQNTLYTQMRRFERGTGDYVTVLDSQRAVLQSRLSLSSAGRDLALSRLGLHRALGGDWALDPVPDPGPQTTSNTYTSVASMTPPPAKG